MKNKGLMQRAGQGIARGASVANIGLAGLLSSCLSQYGEQLTRNVGETIVYSAVSQGIKGQLNPDAYPTQVNVYGGGQTEYPSAVPRSHQFFVCNHWSDLNHNGSAENDEFIGQKNIFTSNEPIALAAKLSALRGQTLDFYLFDAQKNIVKSERSTISMDNVTRYTSFRPKDLPQGEYVAAYYLDNSLIGIVLFDITN